MVYGTGGYFQSTRVGDMDPFVPLYVMEKEGCSHERMREIMSHESGLLGMAGIGSGEMSDILEAANGGNDRAETAVCAFVERVRQYIGAYSAVRCGVDAIAFAGGIGENGVELRERICEGFEFLGVEIDREKNRSAGGIDCRISSGSSMVGVYMARTNEELVVAYFTKEVVRKGQDLDPEEMNFRLG
jgi:acetate kinase